MILFKIVIVGLLAFMVYNLFRALRVMNKNDDKQVSMSKFIGRRLLFSTALILILIIAIMTGYITPNPTPH